MKRESIKLPHAPTLAHFTRASGKTSALDNLLWILEDAPHSRLDPDDWRAAIAAYASSMRRRTNWGIC